MSYGLQSIYIVVGKSIGEVRQLNCVCLNAHVHNTCTGRSTVYIAQQVQQLKNSSLLEVHLAATAIASTAFGQHNSQDTSSLVSCGYQTRYKCSGSDVDSNDLEVTDRHSGSSVSW